MGCGMDDSGGEECTHVIIQSSCLNSSKALNLACSVIVLSGDSKVNLLTATILSVLVCYIFRAGVSTSPKNWNVPFRVALWTVAKLPCPSSSNRARSSNSTNF